MGLFLPLPALKANYFLEIERIFCFKHVMLLLISIETLNKSRKTPLLEQPGSSSSGSRRCINLTEPAVIYNRLHVVLRLGSKSFRDQLHLTLIVLQVICIRQGK